MWKILLPSLLLSLPARPQEPLTLTDAVHQALAHNGAIAVASAGLGMTQAATREAQSGRLPKLNYSESFTRGNNPVFVFGSLLTQHQFAAGNFQLEPLNRPDALNNFQSRIAIDQSLYDGGRTRQAVRSAQLAHQISGEEERRARMQAIAAAARAYYGALLADATLGAAREALRSADADLSRAESVRAAGMSTDVDVLSIRVHRAQVEDQSIRRAADLDVARAALNDAMGLPLDAPHLLTTPLEDLQLSDPVLDSYENGAVSQRPETREVKLNAAVAQTQISAAHAALFPQLAFRAAFEADRQRFIDRGGANWLAAVSFEWNLFNGFGDRARIEEATQALRRARAGARTNWIGCPPGGPPRLCQPPRRPPKYPSGRRSGCRSRGKSAHHQNRYSAGLANVTDLLRTESALLDSRTRSLAAMYDQRVAALWLELAAGKLTEESEVLHAR